MAKGPSAAVTAARGRRAGQAKAREARIEWFIREVVDKVKITLKGRVMLATQFVHTKVVRNISRAVTKSGKVITNRSKPGEFPKADTTQLMKTLFQDVRQDNTGNWVGFVGTPLDYGVILELKRDRSFLKRTLREELPTVKRILTGPIK